MMPAARHGRAVQTRKRARSPDPSDQPPRVAIAFHHVSQEAFTDADNFAAVFPAQLSNGKRTAQHPPVCLSSALAEPTVIVLLCRDLGLLALRAPRDEGADPGSRVSHRFHVF